MLTGQNGILNRATDAKKQTEDVSDLEFLQTKAYEAITNYYVKGQTGSENEYILEELKKVDGVTTNVSQGTVKYNGKTYYISDIVGNTNEQKAIEKEKSLTQITAANATDSEDKKILESTDLDGNAKIRMIIVEETTNNGKVKAVIPSGFYYVTGKPSTGLVISDKFDDDNNNSKGGNQFVWVPCNGGEGVTYETELAKNWKNKYSNYEYWYNDYVGWNDEGGNKNSVLTYGGFYIARYEAGVPSEASFYGNYDGAKYEIDRDTTDYRPVSKKNNPSWNYISQTNAKIVSANMYKESTIVTSQLIDSYAWDTVVEWMEKRQIGIAQDSSTKGNYSNNAGKTIDNALSAMHRYVERKSDNVWIGWNANITYKKGKITTLSEILDIDKRSKYTFYDNTYNDDIYSYKIYTELATGALEDARINNIYDMAGNMYEWTTETRNENGEIYAVRRGGSFGNEGFKATISYRNGVNADYFSYIHIGFRVVLYIK